MDPAAFSANKIYPLGDAWNQEAMEELLDAYEQVAAFFHTAANAGEAILLSRD
jgi:hypothetical protein